MNDEPDMAGQEGTMLRPAYRGNGGSQQTRDQQGVQHASQVEPPLFCLSAAAAFTAPAFTKDRILGAILFEQTMDRDEARTPPRGTCGSTSG